MSAQAAGRSDQEDLGSGRPGASNGVWDRWVEGRESRLRVVRMVGLGVVLWFAAHQVPPGWSGRHLVAGVAEALTGAGWLAWLAGRGLRRPAATGFAGLVLMGTAGGVLGSLAPIAITFPAVAAMAAGTTFGVRAAALVAVAGAATTVLSGLVAGQPFGFALESALAVGAGFALGASWRQNVRRAEAAEALLTEQERADAETARASALAERNRIGQEVHDVLAHSLGALAVQLAAADALLGRGEELDKVRLLIKNSRELAVEGLEDARRAVRALRDEPVALAEQVGHLAEIDGALVSVRGVARDLPPGPGLAVYRAAQEAMTNARKHAPGAAVEVSLDFGPDRTILVVSNGSPPAPPGPLAGSGGGYGLTGMRERVEKAGGSLRAGPVEGGFRVEVSVPA